MIQFSNQKHGNALLNYLAKAQNPTTLDTLAQELGISRRSLYYVIHKVNDELNESGLDGISNIYSEGYYLDSTTINFLKNGNLSKKITTTELFNLDSLSIKLNKHERLLVLSFFLITRNGSSINYLANLLNISRNTVISDLTEVKSLFSKEKLMISNTNKGKIIVGSELIKRNWALLNIMEFMEIISNSKLKVDNSDVETLLEELATIDKGALTNESFMLIAAFLSWYFTYLKIGNRHLKSFNSFPKSEIKIWVSHFLPKFGIANEYENDFISSLIASQPHNGITLSMEDHLYNQLVAVSKKIMIDFQSNSNIIFKQKEKLIIDLTQHLYTTFYRARYGIKFKNPILNQIIKNYPQTFKYTKLSLKPFLKFIGKNLSDDEIALIATYFGGNVRENNNEITNNVSKNAAVVCNSGIGTSKLLLYSLAENFTHINFKGPFNLIQFENINLSNFDYIISTIELPYSNLSIPKLKVSPIPSESDWNSLSMVLTGRKRTQPNENKNINIETLLDIISLHCRIENPTALKKDLQNYIYKFKNKNVKHKISQIIKHSAFISKNVNWKQAINISLAPLLNDCSITDKYETAILEALNKHGNYMNIGNGCMLVHSKPTDGVKKLGTGITVFKNAFTVFDKPTKFNVIITLAPIDNQSHQTFLRELLNLLLDKNWVAKLKNVNSTDELIAMISMTNLSL